MDGNVFMDVWAWVVAAFSAAVAAIWGQWAGWDWKRRLVVVFLALFAVVFLIAIARSLW